MKEPGGQETIVASLWTTLFWLFVIVSLYYGVPEKSSGKSPQIRRFILNSLQRLALLVDLRADENAAGGGAGRPVWV